jgi:hypothetical protein
MHRHVPTHSTFASSSSIAAVPLAACGKGGPAPGADLGGIEFQTSIVCVHP